MAAGLLWVLDVFGNVAMEPFRAFVTDKLPDSQVNRGFIMQSLMIGLGGSIASALPWLMSNVFHVGNTTTTGHIPENVKLSFYVGAIFFITAVLYTVFTTKEYPPSDLGFKNKVRESNKGFGGGLISVSWVQDKNLLFVSMIGVGIAWASILSMPYAMLSGCLPKDKVGVYMGIFNFFIVLPEIIASLGFGWLMKNVLGNDRMAALKIGGGLMIIAALICFLLIKESKQVDETESVKLEIEEQRPI